MAKKTGDEKLMTAHAAAKRFKVSVQRLIQAADAGNLAAEIQTKVVRRIMVKPSDVRDYIDRTGRRKPLPKKGLRTASDSGKNT